MFKRILVPLDGSALAETALAPALVLAERFGAELLLVRTILTHVFPGAHPGPAQLEALHEAERYLALISAGLRGKNVPIYTAIPYDAPAAGIADQAEFRHVDLIVMATHGRKWPETLLHKSVTMSLLEHTPAPILALRVKEEGVGASGTQLPRFMTDPHAPILVPLDGSSLSESALPVAERLARSFDNSLVLVRAAEMPHAVSVTPGAPVILVGVGEAILEETNTYLRRKQQEAIHRGMRVSIESTTSTPAWFIGECAQAHNAGLVVMASHGRSGLGRWLLGSVAQSVLRESAVPVFLVRASDAVS
ncbi:MAG TPA: universal stress protein [Ktedonobacterales bacterium]|jgi:nucleotide-binding universal stress UspA family protein